MKNTCSRFAGFTFVVLSLCQASFAAAGNNLTAPITITSSAFADQVFKLSGVLDAQGDILRFIYGTDKEKSQVMSLESLKEGFSLYDRKGSSVIWLTKDDEFSTQHGGLITVHYMRRVVRPRSQGAFNIAYLREGAQWVAYEVIGFDRKGDYIKRDKPFSALNVVNGTLGLSGIYPIY